MDLDSLIVSYNSQLCSDAADLYLAFETADNKELKLPFSINVKPWRIWSYYSSTQYYYYYYYYYYCIQCWMAVGGEVDTVREIFWHY